MDSSWSEDHPRAAGHPTQTSEVPPPAVPPTAPEPALPHPPPAAATGIENPPSDNEEPLTPAQLRANYDAVEGAIKESMEHIERDDDAPLPLVQTIADYEEMENTIQKSVQQTQSEDAQLPPSQIAALTGTERGDDETDAKTKPALTTVRDDNVLPMPPAASPPQEQDEAIPTPTPRQQTIIVRPPPQSMPASTDEDTASAPVLEGTLVEDRPEATVVPDLLLCDAVPIEEQTRFEKNKKIIVGVGMGLLIGALTAGFSVSSNNGSSGSNTIDPKGVVLSTARPSESSSPSEVPSLQSTARPSESSSPSQFPSLRPTLHPSLYPSTSASPTPFCFGGEINILTDSYPEDTSWTISRIDNVDGVVNSKVVLVGSPEEEGYRTFNEACLERGDYQFAISYSEGDGICCDYGNGHYMVTFDGVVIAQGGDFGSEDKVYFSLPIPSPPPSESSSPSETPSSSLQPSPLPSSPPSTYWSSLNWNRQGLGVNGDASHDWFGWALAFSADASTMAIGAPRVSGNDDRPGYVKVYGRKGEGSCWEQRGETIRGEVYGDNFGHSLALSEDGTTLSIGAPRHDSVGFNSGQVKVYEWNEATLNYTQIGGTLYGAAPRYRFGYSVDISNGKILAVGADESDDNGNNSGQVTIYGWDDASSNFKQRGEAINGDAARDYFGYSVSLAENGQKLAVGAPYNDSNGSDSGQVKLFEWDEATLNYKQLGDSLLGDAAGDLFGGSVSFSRNGTTLAIGAPFNSKNGQYSGQVKVFAWDEAALNFVQIGQSLYGKAVTDEFGHSMVLSSEGKTLAIGAFQRFAGKPGYAEVYGWDEAASEYKRLGQSLGGEVSYNYFGAGLALAGNGRDLAIGAPHNGRNGTSSGRVEVFHIEL